MIKTSKFQLVVLASELNADKVTSDRYLFDNYISQHTTNAITIAISYGRNGRIAQLVKLQNGRFIYFA